MVTDPPTVAGVHRRLVDEIGRQAAQRRTGIPVTVGRAPALEELQDAVTRSGLSLVRLELRRDRTPAAPGLRQRGVHGVGQVQRQRAAAGTGGASVRQSGTSARRCPPASG
jgi:hypothetical protein